MKRLGISMTTGLVSLVIGIIVLAVGLNVGGIVHVKTYTSLEDLQDTDFSSDANDTIDDIDTNFWSGMSMLVIAPIVLAAAALLYILMRYLGGAAG